MAEDRRLFYRRRLGEEASLEPQHDEHRQQQRQHGPAKSERPARAAKQPVERPSGFRKPEVVEVTSARIYVGNLSFDASESDLFELFNGVGSVQNVEWWRTSTP